MNKIILSLSVVVVAASSQAVVAFSSFGAGDSFQNTIAGSYIIGQEPSNSNVNWKQAFKFTSSATGVLDSVRFAGVNRVAPNDGFRWALHADDAGAPAAGFLIQVTYFIGINDGINSYTNPFTTAPVLQAGTDYWISFEATEPDTGFALYSNDQGLTTTRARDINGGTNYTYSGPDSMIAMDVTVVPEPFTMVGLAAMGLAVAARRRKRA